MKGRTSAAEPSECAVTRTRSLDGLATVLVTTLPGRLAAVAAARGGAGAPAQEASEAPAAEADRPTVMIVEDDDDVRDTVRGVLEDEGYGVLDAANGREALEVLEGGARPCVVLLDLMMPVMNGWEMLDALRADGELAKIPVVVVSAMANGAAAPPAGAHRFLSKPLQVATLLAAVEEHCRGEC